MSTLSTQSILLIVLFAGYAFAGTPELLFEAGSKDYLDANYESALDHWKQIEQLGYSSGELFYNLGNAYQMLGKPGMAILYWEKARKLLGDDPDLMANLQIAQGRLQDKLDEPVRLPVWEKLDSFRARFSTGLLTILTPLALTLLFLALAARRWVLRGEASRIPFRMAAYLCLVLFIGSSVLLTLRMRDDASPGHAVLIAAEAEVLSAPARGSGKLLFTLHEGAKVRVVRQLEGWVEISIGKDRQGWVEAGKVGII